MQKHASQTMQTKPNPPGYESYMPPELINGDSYNEKIDVWGTGCIIYEIFHLKVLFACTVDLWLPEIGLRNNIARAVLNNQHRGFDDGICETIKDVILGCINQKAEDRLTASEVLRLLKAINNSDPDDMSLPKNTSPTSSADIKRPESPAVDQKSTSTSNATVSPKMSQSSSEDSKMISSKLFDTCKTIQTTLFDFKLLNEMKSYRVLNIVPRIYLETLSPNCVICCPDPRVPENDHAISINLVSLTSSF